MAPGGERGLTLIEVIVSLVIVFIVFLGLTDAGLVALNHNFRNVLRNEATLIADNVVANARNTRFADLGGLTPSFHVGREVRGRLVDYTVTQATAALDGNNTQLSVIVSWRPSVYKGTRWDNTVQSHQVVTVVSSATAAR